MPGTLTIPQQIEMDKTHYLQALEDCDRASEGEGEGVDIRPMEEMFKSMLAKQLLSVIEAADAGSSSSN